MSSFNNSVGILFDKMEKFISSKTVVGEAIIVGDITIVPLVDVSVGLGAGARETENEKTGLGLGVKITPTSMLIIQNGSVQLVDVKNPTSVNKLIDMVPGIVSKLNLSGIFEKIQGYDTDEDLETKNKKEDNTTKEEKDI